MVPALAGRIRIRVMTAISTAIRLEILYCEIWYTVHLYSSWIRIYMLQNKSSEAFNVHPDMGSFASWTTDTDADANRGSKGLLVMEQFRC